VNPVPPPKVPPAFPDVRPVKPKTSFGAGLRKRWKDREGNIYEWDYQHGAVEAYDAQGHHVGEFDPHTGRQLKGPNPSRRIQP
jgi:hypothetical protein